MLSVYCYLPVLISCESILIFFIEGKRRKKRKKEKRDTTFKIERLYKARDVFITSFLSRPVHREKEVFLGSRVKNALGEKYYVKVLKTLL